MNGRDPPCCADRHVQARARRRDQLVTDEQIDNRARALQHLARMHQRMRPGPGGREARIGHPTDRRRWMWEPSGPGLDGDRDARVIWRCTLGRRRLGVEQEVNGVDRARAVDQAVVGLADQRPAAVRQTVEQHHLPQRTAAVQTVRVEVRDPIQELVLAPWGRKRCVTDVRFDLEEPIGLPRGPGEPAGAERAELLPVARQQVQPSLKVLAHRSDRRRPTPGKRREQQRSADVHQRTVVRLLELQERGVERRQLLVRGHCGPFVCSIWIPSPPIVVARPW
jgi:hypothetical protein